MDLIFVGLGGGIGAIFRYLISLLPNSSIFPIWTLAVNFLGAVLIGFISGICTKNNISNNATLFLKTGLCGGFTTFSTFSLESFNLLNSGHKIMGGTYIVFSVMLCLIGIFIGITISKVIVQ